MSESLYEYLRAGSQIIEESMALQQRYFEKFIEPIQRTLAQGGDPAGGDDPALELLLAAQRALLTHPVAAQAAFAALVAEGRQFAQTEEGARWVTALNGSELLRKGRRMWSAVTHDMLEERPVGALPAAYIELVMQFARSDEDQLDDWARALAPGGHREPA